jgi:hypothetical protein
MRPRPGNDAREDEFVDNVLALCGGEPLMKELELEAGCTIKENQYIPQDESSI